MKRSYSKKILSKTKNNRKKNGGDKNKAKRKNLLQSKKKYLIKGRGKAENNLTITVNITLYTVNRAKYPQEFLIHLHNVPSNSKIDVLDLIRIPGWPNGPDAPNGVIQTGHVDLDVVVQAMGNGLYRTYREKNPVIVYDLDYNSPRINIDEIQPYWNDPHIHNKPGIGNVGMGWQISEAYREEDNRQF